MAVAFVTTAYKELQPFKALGSAPAHDPQESMCRCVAHGRWSANRIPDVRVAHSAASGCLPQGRAYSVIDYFFLGVGRAGVATPDRAASTPSTVVQAQWRFLPLESMKRT